MEIVSFQIFIGIVPCSPCWVYSKRNEALRDTQFFLPPAVPMETAVFYIVYMATSFGCCAEDF